MAASFRRLAENLGRLAQVSSRVSRPASDAINALIRVQFAAGQDPYGKAWKPLLPSTVQRKHGDARILIRTNIMAPNTVARPTGRSGIELVTSVYGGFSQSGTKRQVSRSILPDRGDLPIAWRNAIRTALDAAYKQARR